MRSAHAFEGVARGPFDQRRALLLDEANAIGTTVFRRGGVAVRLMRALLVVEPLKGAEPASLRKAPSPTDG